MTSILSFSNASIAQESARLKQSTLVDLLVDRLGKPDERRDWRGVSLDYQLKDGRIFTITTNEDGSTWAGLKFNMAANVNKKVELVGTYLGPGKEANCLYTLDSQAVFLNLVEHGGTFPDGLNIGDQIEVVGTLRYRLGSTSKRTDIAAASALYHMDDAVVHFAANCKTLSRTKQ